MANSLNTRTYEMGALSLETNHFFLSDIFFSETDIICSLRLMGLVPPADVCFFNLSLTQTTEVSVSFKTVIV